jgi:hypothetical protein
MQEDPIRKVLIGAATTLLAGAVAGGVSLSLQVERLRAELAGQKTIHEQEMSEVERRFDFTDKRHEQMREWLRNISRRAREVEPPPAEAAP